jgi:hypothetical protein
VNAVMRKQRQTQSCSALRLRSAPMKQVSKSERRGKQIEPLNGDGKRCCRSMAQSLNDSMAQSLIAPASNGQPASIVISYGGLNGVLARAEDWL